MSGAPHIVKQRVAIEHTGEALAVGSCRIEHAERIVRDVLKWLRLYFSADALLLRTVRTVQPLPAQFLEPRRIRPAEHRFGTAAADVVVGRGTDHRHAVDIVRIHAPTALLRRLV